MRFAYKVFCQTTKWAFKRANHRRSIYTYSYELSMQGKEWFIQGNDLFKYTNKKNNIFTWNFMKGKNLFMQGHEFVIYKELSDSYIQRNEISPGLFIEVNEPCMQGNELFIQENEIFIYLGVPNERKWDIQWDSHMQGNCFIYSQGNELFIQTVFFIQGNAVFVWIIHTRFWVFQTNCSKEQGYSYKEMTCWYTKKLVIHIRGNWVIYIKLFIQGNQPFIHGRELFIQEKECFRNELFVYMGVVD